MLGDLTSADAVRAAMAEFNRLGRPAFLRKYGFGPAVRYFIASDGRYYDSKAIAGVAYGIEFPERGPLAPDAFRGREMVVKRKLESLGFVVTSAADSVRHFLLKLNAADIPFDAAAFAEARMWGLHALTMAPVRKRKDGRAILPAPTNPQPGDRIAIWINDPPDAAGLVGIATLRDGDERRCRLESVALNRPLPLSAWARVSGAAARNLYKDIDADRRSKLRMLTTDQWRVIETLHSESVLADIATPTIAMIADALDARAPAYAIGDLQTLRAELHGKRHIGRRIFGRQTISKDGWAFHRGGRTELQFNIGLEDSEQGLALRFGVAFSFESSRNFSDPMVLLPKVRLFNDYLAAYPDAFADMRIWSWGDKARGPDYPPQPIRPEWAQQGVFVFLGSRCPATTIDYNAVLQTFDRLLPLYRYVESSATAPLDETVTREPFVFGPGRMARTRWAVASQTERELIVDLRHGALQAALKRMLERDHGPGCVGFELPTGAGTRIDAVRRQGHAYWFYEIKTSASPRACLREAIGQLLEYAHWPGAQRAERLVVVGEMPLDAEGRDYLQILRTQYQLPLDYLSVGPLAD